jgi:hypothetical protein
MLNLNVGSNNAEMTNSEVIAKTNVTSQPSEVKEDYVYKPVVGITAFREDPKVVDGSPMRKKKGTLIKLNVKEDDEEDAYLEKLEIEQKKIQPIFDELKIQFV